MSFKVSFNSKPARKLIRVNYGGVQVPAKFSDLIDFNTEGLQDHGVIMYNAITKTYEIVDPDEVLSVAASQDGPRPGFPTDYLDQMDVDMDDRVDLDAGMF